MLPLQRGLLLMILQRYTFGSKSQHTYYKHRQSVVAYDIAKIYIWKQITTPSSAKACCSKVAYDIAKIYIWKQITTRHSVRITTVSLLMILQRYTFGSKSQQMG